jgi:hypothetical protein
MVRTVIVDTQRALASICAFKPQFMIFASSQKHARALKSEAVLKGLETEVVIGARTAEGAETYSKSYDAHIANFRAGALQGVIVVGRLGRGFDHPPIRLTVIAFATRSRARWVQACCRGSRPSPGKTHNLVLDYGQNFERFKSPDLPALEAVAMDCRAETAAREAAEIAARESTERTERTNRLCPTPSRIPAGVDQFGGCLSSIQTVLRSGIDVHRNKYLCDITFFIDGAACLPEKFHIGYRLWGAAMARCDRLLFALLGPGAPPARSLNPFEFRRLVDGSISRTLGRRVTLLRFPDYRGQNVLQIVMIGDSPLVEMEDDGESSAIVEDNLSSASGKTVDDNLSSGEDPVSGRTSDVI